MNLTTEKFYPYVLAVGTGVIAWWQGFQFPVSDGKPLVEPILTNGITIASIIIGLLTASLTLLPALDSPIMRAVRKSGYILILNRYIAEGIASSLIFAVLSFAGFWVQERHWFPIAWLGSAVLVIATFTRIGKMVFVISSMSAPKP
jgi:hypothetical protein